MYISGHVGYRMDSIFFSTVETLGIGLFTTLFRLGYWATVHSSYYYLTIQMVAGLFQPTGCPSVNAHTSIGNLTGYLVASILLKYGWSRSMIVPGILIAFRKEDEELNKPLSRSKREEESAVGFREAWRIPGVAPFVFCIFLESGNLSTLFDVKGVVGGILTAASFMYCVIPAPCLFRSYGHISVTINIILIIA
ncbi:hypothetical protein R3W88_032086 [Solanum pinnatisectum]|uniref:Uncharacterized protein n=1 Tax=Solanum pinnatisectum TaxID=50273 RepID=A0AAV9LQ38_9SOLN|nr:hypothetical protein R3W88_032086 [Solanum pinnatisectum]